MLQKANGGSGLLLGGVPGVMPAKVVVIGGGKVGLNAAKIACGLGASVRVLILMQNVWHISMILVMGLFIRFIIMNIICDKL